MDAYLELISHAGRRVVPLAGARFIAGRDPRSDLEVDDAKVSRAHLAFENVTVGWMVSDMGSANGTRVNGNPLSREHLLREGDEIVIGTTRLCFRESSPRPASSPTVRAKPLPELTRGERRVLVRLCAPLLSGDPFPQPASVQDIARQLFVTPDAIKQHLINLYEKFELHDAADSRRLMLARLAVLRGAVSKGDIAEDGASR